MATVPSFSDGNPVHASDLSFLLSPPRARAYQGTAGTALADNTFTAITFDTVDYDTDSMWSAGTPTRLTCKTAGLYTITMHCRLPTANYNIFTLNPRVNGSSVVSHIVWNLTVTGTANTSLSGRITIEHELSVSDYVEMYVLQKSGASRTTDFGAGAVQITGMSMRWAAPLH